MLTFYDGSKIEIVSIDNKIERYNDGRCTGQLYYRIKKLTNDWGFEYKYRIKLMDNNKFVPDGINFDPNFDNINVGEVAEGYIGYTNIPYSDTYRLVVETR